MEEERGEVGQGEVWTQGNSVRDGRGKNGTLKEAGSGAGWAMGEEGAGRRSRGVRGVLQNHLSPRDSLVFVSGRLVINRLGSVSLTGGSLGFDGETLISPENSQKTDGETNRRISQKQAHCFISERIPSKSLPPQPLWFHPHSTPPYSVLSKLNLEPNPLSNSSRLFAGRSTKTSPNIYSFYFTQHHI